MATNLEDKQGVSDDADIDGRFDEIAQNYGNDEFNQLTSPEHLAKDGEDPRALSEVKGAEESGAGSGSNTGTGGDDPGAETQLLADAGAGAAAAGLFKASDPQSGGIARVKGFFWSSKLRRRSSIGGGIAGLSIGGLMLATVIGSGPFTFIHLAQQLTLFHFAGQQDASDDRTSKLFRFIHYTQGHPENSRMGAVGNRLATTIENKMNATGITTAYTDKFGNLDGYVIDPEQLANSDLSNLQGKSPEEITTYFKDTYGVTLTPGTGALDGKLFASAEGLGYFASGDMIQAMMQESGYSKVASTLGARIMGRRAGVTWHPLKKLDTKVQNALEKWYANRNSTIEEGDSPTVTAESGSDTSGEVSTEDPATTTATGTATEIAQESSTASTAAKTGATGPITSLQGDIKVKIGLGGAAVVGVACLAHTVAHSASALKQTEVVQPLIRMGVEAISVGNQVMNGEDVNVDELGLLSKQMSSTEAGNVGTYENAQSIQAEEGEKLTGYDASSTDKSVGAPAPFAFLTTGAIGDVLNPVCSTGGQIGLSLLSFIGGPVSAAASVLAGYLTAPYVSDLIQNLAGWLVGSPINPATLAGPAYGNAVNFGARLAADAQGIAGGGIAMTIAEAAQIKSTETLASNRQFHSESLAYQLFNPDDSRTLTSHIIDNLSPSTTQNIASMTSGFLHMGSILSRSFGSIFTGLVHAAPATPYDYGFPEIGFSEADLNNPLVENPYQNAAAATTLLQTTCTTGDATPCGQTYVSRAAKCFGVSIFQAADPDNGGAMTWEVSGGTTNTPLSDDSSGNGCNDTSNINGANCSDVDPSTTAGRATIANPDCSPWLRIRFFIFDTENMDSIGCYENDAQSCDNIDMSNGSSSSTSASTPATITTAGITVNNTAAQQIAQQASIGTTKVGYALFNSGGKLVANYNDATENYGASITKAMLLVAYLKQVGTNAVSAQAQTELTQMIENSDNASANWVYAHLTNGAAAVNAVASTAGMTGFQLDDTSDPLYVLGQSKITANDFAKFFANIDTSLPAAQKTFGLQLLSNLSASDQVGLLKAGLPGTVYSKEGWKPENAGLEGAPYIVNQAAQFTVAGTTYGVAVTVGGATDQTSAEAIIQKLVTALISEGS